MPKKQENVEPIDAEFVDVPAGGGSQLARYERPTRDLALTPVFDLATANSRLAQLREFVQSYMVEGEDYGTIPGTPKPTLYKSGADKLCDIYGMADKYKTTNRVEDWDKGLFDFEVECTLVSKRTDTLISTGMGSCSSFESKYRFRDAKRTCPKCGKEAIIKGKEEFGGGYICWKKEGKSDGCGAKFAANEPMILNQTIGRVENDNLADIKNTILKMAKKRAKVDAVLSATRSSGLFTQDVEDSPHQESSGDAPKAAAQAGQPSTQAKTATPAQGSLGQPAQSTQAAQKAPPAANKTAAPAKAPAAAKPATQKPAPAAKPAEAAPTVSTGTSTAAPAAAAVSSKTPTRSERLRDVCKKTECTSDDIMGFVTSHLQCDASNISKVPVNLIDATVTAIEAVAAKFPPKIAQNFFKRIEGVDPSLGETFASVFAVEQSK